MKEQAKPTTPISIRLENDVLDHLRRLARYESYKRDKDVTYSDLIRDAVVQVYPLLKVDRADEDEA